MLLDGGETICKESGTQAQSGSNFWGTMIDKRQSNMRSSAGDLETKATLAMSKFRENIGINTKPSWAYRRQSVSSFASGPTIPCKFSISVKALNGGDFLVYTFRSQCCTN